MKMNACGHSNQDIIEAAHIKNLGLLWHLATYHDNIMLHSETFLEENSISL